MKTMKGIRLFLAMTVWGMGFQAGAQPEPSPKDAASTFILQAEGLQNEVISFNDFEGRFVVVDIWAPWSPTCKRHGNVLKELARMFEEEDGRAVVLKYALESNRERWLASVAADPVEGAVVHARDPLGHASPLLDRLGIAGPPYVLVLGPDGDLIYRGAEIGDAYRALRKAMRRRR